MTFAWPWLLIAAGVAPVLALLWHGFGEWRARRKLRRVVAPRLLADMLRSVSRGKRWLRAGLFAFALGAVLVALARPQAGKQMVEVERPAVDFLLGLDLSRSMLAEDMDGRSRLEVAKEGLSALLDGARGGRAGLIAFAGEAFLSAPITADHEAVKRHLEALTPKTVARQGTDLAQAIHLARQTFAKGDYETKALVLVTDGEELQGEALLAAREAARDGLRVFTVGAGTAAGARIPLRDESRSSAVRYAQNEFHRDVISRLNAPMLQQLAAAGDGRYAALGRRGEGLEEIWQRGVRPLATTMQVTASEAPEEYFQWPLGAALVLCLMERLVRDRRRME